MKISRLFYLFNAFVDIKSYSKSEEKTPGHSYMRKVFWLIMYYREHGFNFLLAPVAAAS